MPVHGRPDDVSRAAVDRARRWYRALLRILPRRFRERHGADMEELFLESMRSAGSRRRAARGWHWQCWM